MEDELKDILENGKDWETVKTTTPGLFIRKIPATKKKSATLTVEINPPDASGNPTKKRGLMIRNKTELEIFRKVLSMEKIDDVLSVIEKLNPEDTRKDRVIDI